MDQNGRVIGAWRDGLVELMKDGDVFRHAVAGFVDAVFGGVAYAGEAMEVG